MRPLVLAALLAGGGAAPAHRSLGDGGWHAAHPGFVSPTTKAPATNAATQSQRPVFDPAKQLRGCAGVDTLNSNFQHNKFQMVVALKPWRFLATIEMRCKSVSAREAAGLNLAKTAGARVLGWLPAARGRPQRRAARARRARGRGLVVGRLGLAQPVVAARTMRSPSSFPTNTAGIPGSG